MPRFGERSKAKLVTCHPHLRLVLNEAIERWDFTIIYGFRGEAEQNEAFATGNSTKRWPESLHNHVATQEDVDAGFASNVGAPLSLGVDLAPWHPEEPHILWEKTEEFYLLAGRIQGISEMILPKGWYLRAGADWDGDGYVTDQTFHDLGHLELRKQQ